MHLSVDPSFAFRALAHTDTSHGTAADRSPSPPSGSGSGHRCLRHDWGDLSSGKQTWIRREKKGMEGLTRGPPQVTGWKRDDENEMRHAG